MGIEIKVSMHVNVNDDFLVISPDRLLEIARNVKYLVYQPIPISSNFRKELRKKDSKTRIYFGVGYREIRVVRGFKSVATKRVECEHDYGLGERFCHGKQVPDDCVVYHVYNYNLIKEDENPERIALVGMEWFSEEKMRKLRGV